LSKYGDDIRRISKYEKLIQLIEELRKGKGQDDKSPIQGTRGIAYGDGGGKPLSTSKASIGTTKPNNNGIVPKFGDKSTGHPEGSNQSEDPTDGANKQGSPDDINGLDNTSRDGWYDAASILQNIADSYSKIPPIPQWVLNALTGLQTDDGRGIVAHFLDAAFAFVAPITASGPYDPGADPTWENGKYWSLSSPAVAYGPTVYQAVTESIAAVKIAFPAAYPSGYGDAYFDQAGIVFDSPGDYTYTWYQGPGAPPNVAHVVQADCPGPSGADFACTITSPPSAKWTDMGVTQLAWVSPITPALVNVGYNLMGRFIPNPFDINVPVQYQNGASILDVKTLSGDAVRIGPLRDGGWYMYYRDAGADNVPVGDFNEYSVYTVNVDRTAAGFITPNQLKVLLP